MEVTGLSIFSTSISEKMFWKQKVESVKKMCLYVKQEGQKMNSQNKNYFWTRRLSVPLDHILRRVSISTAIFIIFGAEVCVCVIVYMVGIFIKILT